MHSDVVWEIVDNNSLLRHATVVAEKNAGFVRKRSFRERYWPEGPVFAKYEAVSLHFFGRACFAIIFKTAEHATLPTPISNFPHNIS